ncbi:MAG TPA: hypothetical protein VEP28_06340 [Rubrobacter sp.]|nr:hypothetical protein [Rubrobacter sp.]
MTVVENKNAGLLVMAEPLRWAQEICHRMVDVVRIADGALFLEADPQWAGAINAVLVEKGVRVKEIRKQSIPERLVSSGRALST